MKSCLIFSLFILLVMVSSCKKIEPKPKIWPMYSGYWEIKKLHTQVFDIQNQLIIETKEEFSNDERGLAINPENMVYHEMEKKKSVNSCPYYSYDFHKLVLKFTPDSSLAEIQNLQENSMLFIIEEKNASGRIIKYVSAERSSYP